MALTPRSVFRYYETDGVPASGPHKPKKAEIIQLLEQMAGSASSPAVVKQTKADLDAVTPANESYGGLVLNDPDPANNGYYYRDSAAWVKGRGFPDTFAKIALSGSGTAQTGVVDTGIDPADVEVFFAIVGTENTGPLTLSIGGEAPREVVNLAGNPLSAGEWAGVVMFFLNGDGQYQLLLDAGAAASAAASASLADGRADDAEEAAERAETAAAGVEFPVSYGEAQVLSEGQRAQARDNIDALSRDASELGDGLSQLAFQRNALSRLAPFPRWDSTEFPEGKVLYELERCKRQPRGLPIHKIHDDPTFSGVGALYVSGVVDARGIICLVPFCATQTFLFNPYSGGAAFQNGASGAYPGGWDNPKWLGGVLGKNNHIYSAPFDANSIFVWNRPVVPDAVSGTNGQNPPSFTDNMGLSIPAGSAKWYGGVLHPNGKIYFTPHNATQILVIDTNTTPATATLTSMGADLTGGEKWAGSCLAPNGKIYCTPRNAADFLVIDPASNTAYRTNMGLTEGMSAPFKWVGMALGPDGLMYCGPRSAKSVLRLDWRSEQAELFTWGTTIPAGDNLWYGTYAMQDGRIYCVPRNANTFLIIDPINERISFESFGRFWPGGEAYGAGVVGPDGVLYLSPRNVATSPIPNLASVRVGGAWDSQFLLSGFMANF